MAPSQEEPSEHEKQSSREVRDDKEAPPSPFDDPAADPLTRAAFGTDLGHFLDSTREPSSASHTEEEQNVRAITAKNSVLSIELPNGDTWQQMVPTDQVHRWLNVLLDRERKGPVSLRIGEDSKPLVLHFESPYQAATFLKGLTLGFPQDAIDCEAVPSAKSKLRTREPQPSPEEPLSSQKEKESRSPYQFDPHDQLGKYSPILKKRASRQIQFYSVAGAAGGFVAAAALQAWAFAESLQSSAASSLVGLVLLSGIAGGAVYFKVKEHLTKKNPLL